MLIEPLKLNLPYAIYCGEDFLWPNFSVEAYHRVVVIAEQDLANLYADALGWASHLITFCGGEQNKTRETKGLIEDQLFELGCGRDTLLIALGGGVTLDLVGFIGATYCRGIPVIYCPTSLLAMVDATIGGKTGVNTAHGKNLIGCFSEPLAVSINLTCLKTLSTRDYFSGMAEILKHALIADKLYWLWLQENLDGIKNRAFHLLMNMITRSLEIKAQIVLSDYKEKGQRKLLNFGHTFGHALEKISDYQIYHGEAVALGMLYEAKVSNLMGVLDPMDFLKIKFGLENFGFYPKFQVPDDFSLLLSAMAHDKKNRQGQVQMNLIQTIGGMLQMDGQYSFPVPKDILDRAYSELFISC
jgi:3-dehydroquinate synthase